jgi:hypothetical protein
MKVITKKGYSKSSTANTRIVGSRFYRHVTMALLGQQEHKVIHFLIIDMEKIPTGKNRTQCTDKDDYYTDQTKSIT